MIRKQKEAMELLIVLALVIAAFIFIRPQISGMVVGETNQTTLEINKVFNASGELSFSLEGNLTSLAVSGSYSGERVQIYLDELLVYSSENGMNQITGHVTGNNPANETNITDQTQSNITNISVNQINTTEQLINQSVNESVANTEDILVKQFVKFSNECEETCILDNYPANVTLRIIIDNATLNLTSIIYTYLKTDTDLEITENKTINALKNISYTEFEHTDVKIGEPVTWTKRFYDVSSVTIPVSAYDIQTDNEVKVVTGNQKLSLEEFSQLKAGKRGDIRLEVKNNTQITFKTPGPQKTEKEINTYRKQVTISSDIHYRDVLTSTNIPESSKDSITLYWLKDGGKERVDEINYIDTNSNSKIDKIEWIVPHLSNQTYEISITILNPYTYLRDGETWTVAFNTTGMANLTITSPNAGWTEFLNDNPETFDEMEFLDLKCGEESLRSELKLVDFSGNMFDYNELESDNSLEIEKLLVEDYTCDDTGYLSNYMHKAGYATLKFEYANQENSVTDYAYDPENYTYTFGGVTQSTNNHYAYEKSGPITFHSPGINEDSFTCGDDVSYGGYDYSTVTIGTQCWFSESLRVTDGNEYKDCTFTRNCPEGSVSNCESYGGLYNWTDAMCGESNSSYEPSGVQGLCPEGWHLPSHFEASTLERQVCEDIANSNCNTTFPKNFTTTGMLGQSTSSAQGEGSALASGCDIWSDGSLDNSGSCNNDFGTSGFNLLGIGYRAGGGSYGGFETIGRIWTTTTQGLSSGDAWTRTAYDFRTHIERWGYSISSNYQLRCVEDNPYEEATNSDYSNIASSDDNYWVTSEANVSDDFDSQLYKFYINESEVNVTRLDFKWEGYGEVESGYNTTLYAWDYDGVEWIQLDTYDFTSTSDQSLTYSESSNAEKFIDTDGEVTLMAKTKKYVNPCGDNLTLNYGGDSYELVGIGDQCWLRENLNIDPSNANNSNCSGTKYCYDDNSTNCDTYGGLYTWNDAMCGDPSCNGAGESQPECDTTVQGICPNGWHLPSHYEFTALERQICSDIGNTNCDTEFFYDESTSGWSGQATNDAYGEGSAMAGGCDLWTDNSLNNNGACNNDFGTSGLDLLPGSYRGTDGSYDYLSEYAFLWSSTQDDSSNAWLRYIFYGFTEVRRSAWDKNYSYSVRCVRDSNSPYIYTYHNGEYKFLSDFVGGATSKQKEYLDFKDITQTEIEDGKVKLKITEELNETAYIDRIYLRVDESEIVELSSITEANISLLSESDDKYLVMEMGAEHYLEFDAPENYTKLEFAAEGYYIEHTSKQTVSKTTKKSHNSLYTDYVELKVYTDEPPSITTPTLSPEIPFKTDNINCNATPTDSYNTTLDVEYFWYNCTETPCSLFSGGNKTGLSNNTNYVIDTLSSTNTHVGEIWNCSVRSYDGKKYSDFASANTIIYGMINGTIKDSESDPVENAEIEVDLHQSDYQVNTTSDATGYWSVDVNQTGYYKITGILPTNSSMGIDAEAFVEVTP